MAVRPIDANAMLSELRPVSFEAEHSAVLLSDVSKMMREWVERQPTLTPPNEWVKVMEAINNAAVAYIEGGPYENDLPGMEFALKIDRLSRGFVRPPEGEEDT